MAAFINGLTLVLISFYILYEAFRRLKSPVDVDAHLMIWVAAAGVAMNGVITLLLMRGHRDINVRSALLHEIGDTLSTAAVIAGGVAIAYTGQHWIDPALSVGIGVMILWSSIGIIRESLNILLEGTPRGMDLARIEKVICAVPGVCSVHDLHVWSIGSDTHSLSCHVGIEDMPGLGECGDPGEHPRRIESKLPHSSHYDPVRVERLRGGGRLCDPGQPRSHALARRA